MSNRAEFDRIVDGQFDHDDSFDAFAASLDSRIQPDGGMADDVALAEQLENDYGITTAEAFKAIEMNRQTPEEHPDA